MQGVVLVVNRGPGEAPTGCDIRQCVIVGAVAQLLNFPRQFINLCFEGGDILILFTRGGVGRPKLLRCGAFVCNQLLIRHGEDIAVGNMREHPAFQAGVRAAQ